VVLLVVLLLHAVVAAVQGADCHRQQLLPLTEMMVAGATPRACPGHERGRYPCIILQVGGDRHGTGSGQLPVQSSRQHRRSLREVPGMLLSHGACQRAGEWRAIQSLCPGLVHLGNSLLKLS